MERSTVNEWGASAWAYLSVRWGELVLPSLLVLCGTFVMLGAVYLGMAVFGLSFLFAEKSALYPVLGGLVGLLCGLVGMELFQPLILGYTRGTMRSMRGEGFPLSELWGGYRSSVSVLVLTLLQSTLVTFGMLLCFVPGLLASVVTSLSMVALAERDRGGVDALTTSIQLVRERFLDVCLWFLVLICVVMVVSMIPLVGSIAAMPIATVMNVTAYLFLVKDRGEPVDAPTA